MFVSVVLFYALYICLSSYLTYFLLFVKYLSDSSFWLSRASRGDEGQQYPLEHFCLCPAHPALWFPWSDSIHQLEAWLNWHFGAAGEHGEESPALAACSRQECVHFVLSKYNLGHSQSILEHVHSGGCTQSVFQAFVKMKSRWTKASDEAVKLENWKLSLQSRSPKDRLSWVTKLWLFPALSELA